MRLMAAGHIRQKMIRIDTMADRIPHLDRRELMAGLGAAVLGPAMPRLAAAQRRPSLLLQAKAGDIALRPEGPKAAIWSLEGPTPDPGFRFRRGDELQITLGNELPVPIALNWHGVDGVPAAEPLAGMAPLPPGDKQTFAIPMRQAGTFLCDLRLLGDRQTRPSRPQALIVGESEPIAVDRDEMFLIEDWRLRPDGTAIAPDIDAKDTTPFYTVNGRTTLDIPARINERLRLRFINGLQRNIIAVKIEGNDVRIMALDSAPAEPFFARGGTLVMAPGTRVDAFIDATGPPGSTSSIILHDGREPRPIARLIVSKESPIRDTPLPPAPPLPSSSLPTQLNLKNAVRVDLTLDGTPAAWLRPANFTTSAPPAFHTKVGRTVVLSLTNRADMAAVFHLHGHHFRLLDRLDDGWKPFWLDTLAIDAGQTQRIAFAAEYSGRWLMESMATHWAAPRLVRWYTVE